jgi:hypothetical protein
MHKNFGEWYRLVSIEPDGEKLQKRWDGVEEWTTALREDDRAILETVRIFQGLSEKTSREAFLEAFRNHDAAFPQRNELELRVLAGASLVECAYQSDAEADDARAAIIAGTALETSNLLVADLQLREVAGEVLAGLQKTVRSQRERPAFDASAINDTAQAASGAMKKVAAAADLNQITAPIQTLFQSLVTIIRALADASQSLRCADEEINILWWLEGDSSRDINVPWSALHKHAVPLIAGKELADLTNVTLGPQDVAALLHRIVSSVKCKETTIEAYVNAVPNEWVKAHAATTAGHGLDLAPISLALSHRAQSDSSNWKQFFDASSGISASTSLTPERVARQAYMEAVLLRTLADAKDVED